jgi:hypothetical protein
VRIAGKYGSRLCVGTPTLGDRLLDWWLNARKRVSKARCKAFDSIFALTVWSLWLQHNSKTFDRATVLVEHIWSQGELWCRARLIDRLLLLGE